MKYVALLLSVLFTGCISLSFGGHDGADNHIAKESHKRYYTIHEWDDNNWCNTCENGACTAVYCAGTIHHIDTIWIREEK